jgi:hypothetical protein
MPFIGKSVRFLRLLYEAASTARLPAYLALRTTISHRCSDPACDKCLANRLAVAGWTDVLVCGRLILAALSLTLTPHRFQALGIVLAAGILYDVLLAHLTHLFDPHVGAGGSQARLSSNRSLLIAVVNTLVLTLAFATLYRMIDSLDPLRAFAVSLSALTTLGLYEPRSDLTRAIALGQTVSAIFMLTVVLSTILQGLTPRKALDE